MAGQATGSVASPVLTDEQSRLHLISKVHNGTQLFARHLFEHAGMPGAADMTGHTVCLTYSSTCKVPHRLRTGHTWVWETKDATTVKPVVETPELGLHGSLHHDHSTAAVCAET